MCTVVVKLTKVILGLYFALLFYQAGLETLAYALIFGGGGYVLAQAIDDWRNGRKPWLPIERVRADDFQDNYQRAAKLGTFLGRLGKVPLGAYLVYIIYRAGMPTLAYGLMIGGSGYALVKTVLMWRRGVKPWHPTERVQRFE